jgi:molybdenum cofactor cytidylyltransferase
MIAAVLLAAGSARRFDGTQKLLVTVPYEGSDVPLLRLSALGLIAAGIERIVVVVGRESEEVRLSLDGLALVFATNPDHESGMSSSVRSGIEEAVQRWPDSPALLIALGDQPLVGTGIVESLGKHFGDPPGTGAPSIVAPRYRGEHGTPVLFARDLAPELLAITGDHGARAVVERDPARVQYVDFDRPAPQDVDTITDLAALRKKFRYS